MIVAPFIATVGLLAGLVTAEQTASKFAGGTKPGDARYSAVERSASGHNSHHPTATMLSKAPEQQEARAAT